MNDFAASANGRRFFEQTAPTLVREVSRLATVLEKLVRILSDDGKVSIEVRVQPKDAP
ncbi:MAG: hypothetical protein IPI49_19910 [Myxococcales bacterium]|nr:hypothetical protein [Myxococcales bacterium]